MGFFNKEYVVLDNLNQEELENILAYIDEKDSSIFGMTGRRFLQVDVRYSRYVGKVFFKLTIPKSWIEPTGLDTALDLIKRGVV